MKNDKYRTLVSKDNDLLGNLIHAIDKYTLLLYNNELAKFQLTFQQGMIILFINEYQDKKVYQKDIEILMGLKNPSVTTLIKSMIAKDFIYRIQDEEDGRFFHLHLTAKSLSLVDDVVNVIYDVNEKLYSSLTDEEISTLNILLKKLYDSQKNLYQKCSDDSSSNQKN